MCLTLPARIEAIEKGVATVRQGRERLSIDLGLVSGAKVGDWVLYAQNRAVKLISAAEAREIKSLLK